MTCPPLQAVNAALSSFEQEELFINAKVEVYTCKKVGEEKRLARQLEQRLAENKDPSKTYDRDTRKKIINLILTMNASFSDYDFSDLEVDDFTRQDPAFVTHNMNKLILDPIDVSSHGFRANFWSTLDDVMGGLKDCEVFSYHAETDECFGEENLWAVLYFFFSKKAKKMAVFSAAATSQQMSSGDDHEAEDVMMEAPKPTGIVDVGLLDWDELGVDANSQRDQWMASSRALQQKQLTPVFSPCIGTQGMAGLVLPALSL